MTTIVANRERMVADSKITMERIVGNDTSYTASKIWILKNAIIGTAGCSGDGEKFVAWFKKKRRPTLTLEKGFEALVLTPEGVYHVDEDCSMAQIQGDWYAIGSGSAAALGALHAGVTLEEAVEIACKVDTYTGLPIQVAKLPRA